jgi:hypothetical protein
MIEDLVEAILPLFKFGGGFMEILYLLFASGGSGIPGP